MLGLCAFQQHHWCLGRHWRHPGNAFCLVLTSAPCCCIISYCCLGVCDSSDFGGTGKIGNLGRIILQKTCSSVFSNQKTLCPRGGQWWKQSLHQSCGGYNWSGNITILKASKFPPCRKSKTETNRYIGLLQQLFTTPLPPFCPRFRTKKRTVPFGVSFSHPYAVSTAGVLSSAETEQVSRVASCTEMFYSQRFGHRQKIGSHYL